MNTKKSKTNEPHRFRLSLVDKLNLKNPNKNIALGNLSIYYTLSAYNNDKFRDIISRNHETIRQHKKRCWSR